MYSGLLEPQPKPKLGILAARNISDLHNNSDREKELLTAAFTLQCHYLCWCVYEHKQEEH